MKAVIYARYSSDGQSEEPIDAQLRVCTEYAQKSGMTVIGSYIDRAVTGKNDQRPEFQKMMKATASRQFDVILVWKYDRFARSRYDSAMHKQTAKKNGVKTISVTELLPDNSASIILESVIDGFSEYFSAQLSENVIRGMDERALKCEDLGVAPPPGYKVVEHHYVVDEDMRPLIERIFEMYSKGFLAREIIEEVNAKGFRNHKGKQLTKQMLHRLLKSRKYIGEYKWRDIVTPGGVPAIIDDETFAKVQQRMEQKKHAPAMAKAKVPFILTTKLFCGTCKGSMFGDSGTGRSTNKYYYYSCNKSKKRTCARKSVKKTWLEDLIVYRLVEEVFQPEVIAEITDMVLEQQEQVESAIPLLTAQKAAVEKKLANVMMAIEKGILTETTQARMMELEQEKKDYEIAIAQEQLAKPKLSRAMILDWFDGFSKGDVDSITYRQLLIDFFVKKIVLRDKDIIVTINRKSNAENSTENNTQNATQDADQLCILCSDLTSGGTPPRPEYERGDIAERVCAYYTVA